MAKRATATRCLGEEVCEHFQGERMHGVLDYGSSFIWHGDDREHGYHGQAGVMPEGTCGQGHDLALERWLHGEMQRAHTAAPAEMEGE